MEVLSSTKMRAPEPVCLDKLQKVAVGSEMKLNV